MTDGTIHEEQTSSTQTQSEGPDQSGPSAAAGAPGATGTADQSDPVGDPLGEPDLSAPVAGASATASSDAPAAGADQSPTEASTEATQDADPTATLAAERLVDLQRLQAEYVNYKRRVERDRAVAGDLAVGKVIESLLPVLDDLYLAQQHGDLEGSPFASIADKLDATLVKQGVQRYGQPGEAFDPTQHEALMRTEAELAEGTTTTTVVQVLQPGYRLGERVLRPARVAVADPS